MRVGVVFRFLCEASLWVFGILERRPLQHSISNKESGFSDVAETFRFPRSRRTNGGLKASATACCRDPKGMHVILGADHRGFPLKAQLTAWLGQSGHAVEDVGAKAVDVADDYPDFGAAVGRAVASDPDARGIVACGSGIGIVIAANKVRGARAGTCATPEQAAAARRDEDLNVLGLSSDALDLKRAKPIVTAFLKTPYSGLARHARRVKKLHALEQKP